jgi:ElaB/YqjD/DUF883 family membrane-anchored ribosome-binding protein
MSEPLMNKVADQLDDLAYKLEELYDEADIDQKIELGKLKTREFIIKRPLESVGIGLAAGLIIGKLLSRDN